jgi:integrase
MKKKKQISSSKQTPGNSPMDPLPKSAKPVEEVIEQFLHDKAANCHEPYILALRHSLKKLAGLLGNPPVGSLTRDRLNQVLAGITGTAPTQRTQLLAMKTFVKWCRSQGYLPRKEQKPSAPSCATASSCQSRILTPAELKRLLFAAGDVEVRLCIAISAFSGIRTRELEQLSWDCIQPGAGIRIAGPSIQPGFGVRIVPILPVLEPWLTPFRGTLGPVVSRRGNQRKFYPLARSLGISWAPNILRNSYTAYRFVQTNNLQIVADETGHDPKTLQHRLRAPVPLEAMAEFFLLTPQEAGIKNWPELVAIYLSQQRSTNGGK